MKYFDEKTSYTHTCLIPHNFDIKGNRERWYGEHNRKTDSIIYINIEGKTRKIPANIAHYTDPDLHKPYARFMPDLPFMKRLLDENFTCLPGDNEFLDEKNAELYGFIHYIRKNGENQDFSPLGYIKTSCKDHSSFFGKIVMTRKSNNEVIKLATLQDPKYYPLCREVAYRTRFHIMLAYLLAWSEPARQEISQGLEVNQQKVMEIYPVLAELYRSSGETKNPKITSFEAFALENKGLAYPQW